MAARAEACHACGDYATRIVSLSKDGRMRAVFRVCAEDKHLPPSLPDVHTVITQLPARQPKGYGRGFIPKEES